MPQRKQQVVNLYKLLVKYRQQYGNPKLASRRLARVLPQGMRTNPKLLRIMMEGI